MSHKNSPLQQKNEKKLTLKTDFYDLFGEQYFRNLKLNNDPLYFISPLEHNKFEDFTRLKKDLMDHKKVNFIRFVNIQSILAEELSKYCRSLGQFASTALREKISNAKIIDDRKKQTIQTNEKYSDFLNYVKRRIENCKNILLIDEIFEIILNVNNDFNGTYYKYNAYNMVWKIEKSIKDAVNKFMEKHLTNSCIDPINERISEVNNNNPTGISIYIDMDYNISRDFLNIPNYDNIKDIFWWFEFGEKTSKVKDSYNEFLQSKVIKNKIIANVKDFYNNEFTKIKTIYENSVDCAKRKQREKEQLLDDDLRKLKDKLEILSNYEKDVFENEKKFNSSFM